MTQTSSISDHRAGLSVGVESPQSRWQPDQEGFQHARAVQPGRAQHQEEQDQVRAAKIFRLWD